jgi:hypothetical protein
MAARENHMLATKTIVINPTAECWTLTLRIKKPSRFWRKVATVAAFALSVGFNLGFAAPAFGAESEDPCQASAELHYELSGGEDAAYEDALEACHVGMTFSEWRAYEPSECEELAGKAYDRTGDPEAYRTTEAACEALAEAF